MASAAFTSVIKQTGTAVAMVTEACTLVTSSVYQVTSASKRIIDPDTALSVIDNGTPVVDTDITVDYLFGKFTKISGAFTGPVTVTAAYLPSYAVAEARGFEINCSANLLDTTLMAAATANRTRIAGLKDANGTLTGLDNLLTDLDSGGTTIVPFTDFAAGTRRVLEITFPSGQIFRAFALFESIKGAAEGDGLFQSTLSWKAVAATGVDQTEASCFGFSS